MIDNFIPESELPIDEAGNSSLPTETELPTGRARSMRRRRSQAKKVGAEAATEPLAARPNKPVPETKAHAVLKCLRAAKGVTTTGLIETTGWQAHSVRGFLSGTVKKKLGLPVVSEVGKDGIRRYRIAAVGPAN